MHTCPGRAGVMGVLKPPKGSSGVFWLVSFLALATVLVPGDSPSLEFPCFFSTHPSSRCCSGGAPGLDEGWGGSRGCCWLSKASVHSIQSVRSARKPTSHLQSRSTSSPPALGWASQHQTLTWADLGDALSALRCPHLGQDHWAAFGRDWAESWAETGPSG